MNKKVLTSEESSMLSNLLSRGCRDINDQLQSYSGATGQVATLNKIRVWGRKLDMDIQYNRIEIIIKRIK